MSLSPEIKVILAKVVLAKKSFLFCPCIESIFKHMQIYIHIKLLTAILLIVRWWDQVIEAHILVKFHAEDQSNLQQNALQLSDADVIDGACAKFPEELFRPQTT